MLQRPFALMLAALLAASCATSPTALPSRTSTLALSLADLYPADRQLQALSAGTQATVTVTGPGLDTPLSVTTAIDGSSALATLTGIPVGPNRVIELETRDASGAVIPGGRFRTTATLQEGANTAQISPDTTPRGDVFAKLLADGSELARTLDAGRVQTLVEAIQRTQRVEHVALVDGEAIARALIATGGNFDALAAGETAFVQKAARLTVTVTGLPSNLAADVWVDDPVSPVQTGLKNGTIHLAPIKPGTWRLHARAGSLRLAPVTVTPGPDAKATLDFSGSHEALADMPQPRGAGASGVLPLGGSEKLVVAGGLITTGPLQLFNRAQATDSVVAFDGTHWTTLAEPMPTAVSHAAYTTRGNSLWVLGGVDANGNEADAVQVFDGETWTTVAASLPVPIVLGNAAAVGDTIVMIPGFKSVTSDVNGNLYFTMDGDLYTMDATAPGTWTPRGALTTARMGAAVAVMNEKVYVISGLGAAAVGTKPVYAVEVFDPKTGRVSAIAPIPTARMSASAWVANGKLYVAGGIDSLGKSMSNFEAYDPLTDRWEILPPLRMPRAHAATGLVNQKRVLAGGHDSLFYFGDLQPVAGAEALTP